MTWWRDNSERGRTVRRVLFVTSGLNAGVAAAKLWYGSHAGALAISADGFHSTMDTLGNVVALVGVSVAAKPADAGHPYGHRKVEVLLASLVGVLLLVTAFNVARQALHRIDGGDSTQPNITALAFVVLIGTLVVNVGVSVWEAAVGKNWASPLLVTDAWHTRSDVAVTIAVIGSSVLSRFGVAWADAATGAVVAAFVAFAGVRLLLTNGAVLVDAVVLPVAEVRASVLVVPGVTSVADVRTRGVAGAVAMDMRVQVNPEMTVGAGHAVAHSVADAVRRAFPDVHDVVVHIEPAVPPSKGG